MSIRVHIAALESANKAKDEDIKNLKELLMNAQAVIAAKDADIAQLSAMQTLRQNLYALVDSFHLKAQAIVDSDDKDFEARELKILADQLLTCVGLPTRDAA